MPDLAGLDQLDGRHVIAGLSGGKDSVSMCLAFLEAGIPFTPVFLDTGWETRWTYDYIRGPLTERLGPIVETRATIDLPPGLEPYAQAFEERLGHYSAMVRLCLLKGMFPSRTIRFCTQVLKIFALRDYLTASSPTGFVNAVGIRHEEGKNSRGESSRANAAVWEHSQTHGCEVWHPLVHWMVPDLVEIHQRHGLEPNRHYLAGSERVGCSPCIYARKSEIAALARHHPERVDLLRDLEALVADLCEWRHLAKGTTLEAEGHRRPTWFQSRTDDRIWMDCPACMPSLFLDDDHLYATGADLGTCEECEGFGRVRRSRSDKAVLGEMWPIDDVVRWSRTNTKGEPFTPLPHEEGCMQWGLCANPQRSLFE